MLVIPQPAHATAESKPAAAEVKTSPAAASEAGYFSTVSACSEFF